MGLNELPKTYIFGPICHNLSIGEECYKIFKNNINIWEWIIINCNEILRVLRPISIKWEKTTIMMKNLQMGSREIGQKSNFHRST